MANPRQASSTMRLLSPFTNLGSLQFPLSRIRGASFKKRFKQTYEVFRGHTQKPDNSSSSHFGVTEYALVVPTALYAADTIFKKAQKFVGKAPYIGFFIQVLLAISRLLLQLTSKLVDLLVVVPVSLIMTALSTPGITLAHLTTVSPSETKLQELTLQLQGHEGEVESKDLSTYQLYATQSRLYGHPEDDFQVWLQNDTKESTIDVIVATPEQKEAFKKLLSCNAFGTARFFDAQLENESTNNQILDSLYPRNSVRSQ